MNARQKPDVLAWLALGIYATAFPAVIMLVATMLVGSFKPAVSLESFLSFSILLAI
jgi:hypothetical protein